VAVVAKVSLGSLPALLNILVYDSPPSLSFPSLPSPSPFPPLKVYLMGHKYEAFQIEITKKYGVTEWREDVKKVLRTAGLDGRPIVFLFSDTQIVDEIFLEDINNVLNSGDVPNVSSFTHPSLSPLSNLSPSHFCVHPPSFYYS
jgi:hypothetical protein